MDKPQITLQDLGDLKICGNYKFDSEYEKLFYNLKNAILENYAMQYGYTLQEWDDESYYNDDENDLDIYATHFHLLKRFFLSTQDGNYISKEFHIPTNEFRYICWAGFGFEKASDNYYELQKNVTNSFKGKKKYTRNKSFDAIESFHRLYNRFGFLLTANITNPYDKFFENTVTDNKTLTY